MIAGSKGLNPYELAHSWGLLTTTLCNKYMIGVQDEFR